MTFTGSPNAGQGLRDRGAVAVEAALLIPVLVLLLLGIAEWSLVLRDAEAVTNAARVGVRTATAMPRLDDFTQATVDAIGHGGSAMPKANFDFVLVYKANSSGLPGTQTSGTPTCSGASSCEMFAWDGSTFVRSAGTTWDPLTINACPSAPTGGPPDSVGVYVEATHRMVTGLFGSSRVVRDRAVLRFEPMRIGACK